MCAPVARDADESFVSSRRGGAGWRNECLVGVEAAARGAHGAPPSFGMRHPLTSFGEQVDGSADRRSAPARRLDVA